jgi:hypothetical protein
MVATSGEPIGEHGAPPPIPVRTVADADIVEWIQSGTPFSLSRWGNGEWHSVFGRTKGRTTGRQDFGAGLGEALRAVLRSRPPYMMELKRWETVFGSGVDEWLTSEGLEALDWIAPDVLHRASIKGRIQRVVDALRQAPDFVAIGPDHLKRAQDTLGFRKLVKVPTANAFDAYHAIRRKAVKQAEKMPQGGVITLSAGMTAKVLVDDLYRQFGDRLIILDVGSLWDPYAGVLSRSYMRAGKGPVVPSTSAPAPVPAPQPARALKPAMTPEEIVILQFAANSRQCAIEYGGGGSTFSLLEAGVRRLVTIESDPAWVHKLREHELLRPEIESGRLVVHHADIGPTRKLGYPEDRSRINEWSTYWQSAWELVNPGDVDLVVVDGRFRVACALNAILKGSQDLTVVVHDFWKRPKYDVLLRYFHCACRAGSTAVLVPKGDIKRANVKEALRRYARSPL